MNFNKYDYKIFEKRLDFFIERIIMISIKLRKIIRQSTIKKK